MSGKRAIILKRKELHLGLAGSSSTYMGYLWPCRVQGHFGVIRCTCEFSENNISETILLLQIAVETDHTSHKTTFGMFEFLFLNRGQ